MTDAFLYEPGTQKGEVAKEFIRLTREVVELRVKLEAQREAFLGLVRELAGRIADMEAMLKPSKPVAREWGIALKGEKANV
jgi:hypothetical protein